jgi:hypothetical protein
MPVRYDEQRGTRDANSTEQREYAPDPVVVHGCDVMDGDHEVTLGHQGPGSGAG